MEEIKTRLAVELSVFAPHRTMDDCVEFVEKYLTQYIVSGDIEQQVALKRGWEHVEAYTREIIRRVDSMNAVSKAELNLLIRRISAIASATTEKS